MVALDPDAIVDRRRIKRRLSLWRFLAIAAVVIAGIVVAYTTSEDGLPFARKSHIAAIDIDGLITGRHSSVDLLRDIKDSKAVKALIVRIDSPGGSTAGSEILYEELRAIAEEKPVVAVMETVAASGGYLIALASDHVVARGNTITGSIGVMVQWARVDEALASIGIEMNEIKTSPLKAEPDLFGETSPLVRAVTERMVRDSYEWFVSLVAERRPIDLPRARIVSDGRVYTGRQALEAGLIDEIGGENEAKQWLIDEKDIDEDLEIVDWEADGVGELPLGSRLMSWVFDALGLRIAVPPGLDSALGAQRLDGLLSVWHPNLHR